MNKTKNLYIGISICFTSWIILFLGTVISFKWNIDPGFLMPCIGMIFFLGVITGSWILTREIKVKYVRVFSLVLLVVLQSAASYPMYLSWTGFMFMLSDDYNGLA